MTDQIDAVEADEADVLPETQADETQTENTEAEAEAEVAEEQPKPKKSAQERINEVTAARREAEREAAYWRRVALERQDQPQPQARQEPAAEPDPAAYPGREDDPQYIIAVAEHRAEQRVMARINAQRAEEDGVRAYTAFEQKVAEQFPDGEPEGIAALKALPAIRREITDVIFASAQGPALADHLGANPSALRRLEGLPAHMVGFELAKIEAGLTAPAVPQPKRVTTAPEPAPKPRGAGGQFQVQPDTNDFAAFERLADKVRAS